MKKLSLFFLLFFAVLFSFGQSMKGPDEISYFQAPAKGVQFTGANVFMSTDHQLIEARNEAQADKVSGIGGKFGGFGDAVAGAINDATDMIANANKAIDAVKDDKGRFANWSFVPDYIIADPEQQENVIVEIFILNDDPNAGSSLLMMNQPLQADKDGYYEVPYAVNCRYKITTARGELIAENNMGLITGTQLRRDYIAPPQPGGIGSVTVTVEELTAGEKAGINVAYNRVRQDVFSLYGFGQFATPMKLGKVKEIKAANKMMDDVLDVFVGKQGLLLNADEKALVQQYVDLLENDLSSTSDKSRWVALHNLSLCYAWLEEPEKAAASYQKYTAEISETLDEMEKWNLLLKGELPKSERKGLVIGMKDQKKYQNYNEIKSFVHTYPVAAKRYEKLFYTINRDLKKFVDYYAHNDILCQLFELDYPFQFFPLNDFEGSPKALEGVIAREGMEPINYKVKFDNKRRIKEVTADQVSLLDDGSKEKIITRDLEPVYHDETGNYLLISTPKADGFLNATKPATDINYSYDPLTVKTRGRASDITRKFESSETVQLKVDLDGDMYFTGASSYGKANAVFKDVLTSNGIEMKRVNTKTNFTTKASINEKGVLTNWQWLGDVVTNFGAIYSSRVQRISADEMQREINFQEVDAHGNPQKVAYNFRMQGKVEVEQKLNIKQWFVESYAQGRAPKGDMSEDSFDFEADQVWDCNFVYDNEGNWTNMQVGPYSAQRTFKY
ncbi:MAG: hypothetical protein RBR87_08955 [Bacteroidales bacterium]|jgi:hypothetical protein|nr:hypothetical protein [Bacteroidales bacterium]